MKTLILSVTALLTLSGCATTNQATETEKALCRAWANSLPTRSHGDTQQTQDEIGIAITVQKAACK